MCAAVARDLHYAVIGSGPDLSLFHRRLSQREDHASVFDAEVIDSEAAGVTEHGFVIECEIGADGLPSLSAISGLVHILATHIDSIVVVRRDGERIGPVHAQLDLASIRSHGSIGPDADGA